jgi:hypothetical protein
MRDPFEVFLTSVVSIRKADGTLFEKLKASVSDNKIEIHDVSLPVDVGDIAIRQLPNGREENYRILAIAFKEGVANAIPGWLELRCERILTMPVFGSYYEVTIVRHARTAQEASWKTRMGGDLARKALFHMEDRVKTGDEIHSEVFDEPRVVARVDPSLVMEGVSHWEATIMPQSEWNRLHRNVQPTILVSGQGARVNLGSLDQSVQYFGGATGISTVLKALDEIREAIKSDATLPEADKNDAGIDVEQVKSEIQRSKPDSGRIWTLVERLSSVAGLAIKVGQLASLLEHLGLHQ